MTRPTTPTPTPTPANNPHPVRVAIIGGGIAGVTLLLALLNHTTREILIPHLYKATPEFSEIGAGIAFGLNSMRAMEFIDRDMVAAYSKHATFQPDSGARETKLWSSYRMGMDGQDRPKNALKEGDYIHEVHAAVARSSVHRARFLEAMTALLPAEGDYVSFARRLVAIEETGNEDGGGDGTATVRFADGTQVVVDAVIGCDGVMSRVRQILLHWEEEADAVFSGKYAYRGLIPMEEAVEALGEYTARNNHFFGAWQDDECGCVSHEEGWALGTRLASICIPGDAAHASTPHQGAGVGMAFEDVCVLSRLLGEVKEKRDLERAFRAYDAVRRSRTQRLVITSRDAGPLYQCQKEDVFDDVEKFREDLDERMWWIWDLDLEAHLEEALSSSIDQENTICLTRKKACVQRAPQWVGVVRSPNHPVTCVHDAIYARNEDSTGYGSMDLNGSGSSSYANAIHWVATLNWITSRRRKTSTHSPHLRSTLCRGLSPVGLSRRVSSTVNHDFLLTNRKLCSYRQQGGHYKGEELAD
ncbi:FAD/NAD(P)-binding domain-containing protein [Aspergillus heteromorphus CBS 117.55]|uniref:FAD/NAD(P)-binding domain-containing protein n=1 Tax=Aspergillus heteromorphus CBS 117.55 TaxID=1448321 RepID=A0A317X459_9EURO|nr:FAD/NAD(P)-binding domain-containing protein [Aspergillus heteromorphus CBS 117.55]PWY92297.1 FAD/NAD(P)-binding domain-containing protein [Aspergillus heteromorphus CBS 117.55]